MLCKECRGIIVCHGFVNTECIFCSAPIITGHTPGHRACLNCSEKHWKCQQCGKDIIKGKEK